MLFVQLGCILALLCNAVCGDSVSNATTPDKPKDNIVVKRVTVAEISKPTRAPIIDNTLNRNMTIRRQDPSVFSYAGSEYLEIKPLKRNNMMMSFDFETNHSVELYPDPSEVIHYDSFPKAIGLILQDSQAREMHLRFGQGWYDSDIWGKLPRNGTANGGSGVELWAVIEASDRVDAMDKWTKLANSLSGLFCASLNFIDSSSTTTPVKLFQPNIDALSKANLRGELYLFRSALPREPFCTENLASLKILPTKGKAGISSLLTGKKVFNSEWSTLAVDIETVCDSASDCHYQLKQSVDLVKNIPRVLEKNIRPIPKPIPGGELRCDKTVKHDIYHCFPLPESNKLDFDLWDIFGKPIHGGALMASNMSKVCVDIDPNQWQLTLNTSDPNCIPLTNEKGKICYNLDTDMDYDFRFATNDSTQIEPLESPPIYASRSLSGYSQDSGGFRIDLYNPSDEAADVVVFETFPWFVRLYLHTLQITVNETDTYDISNTAINSILNEIIYDPAVDRKSPSHLEMITKIPAKTKVKFSLDFDKAMLLYAEYPPDANHGFEIEPAIVAIMDPETGEPSYTMRTTTALLTLPTPDFSMPYNVIILTSTTMSLAFGAFFNLLTKKTVTEEDAELIISQSPLKKVVTRITALKQKVISSIFKKKSKKSDKKLE